MIENGPIFWSLEALDFSDRNDDIVYVSVSWENIIEKYIILLAETSFYKTYSILSINHVINTILVMLLAFYTSFYVTLHTYAGI